MPILPQTSSPLSSCSLTLQSRMNPSAEGASAPSAEVIGDYREYELQQEEATEQTELYTSGMHHVNQIIIRLMACLSLAKGYCAYIQWKFSTTPTRSRRHHGTIRSFVLIV